MTPPLRWRLCVAGGVALVVLLVDQLTKLAVRAVGDALHVTVIPGVIDFLFVRNIGAAFSMGEGHGIAFAVLALAVGGAVSVLLSPADWLPHVIGALCVSVPMFLLCLVIDGAFGGGDIKLMAAAGLFLGWQNTLLAMFFGIVFGGMYGIYLLAAKKAGKKDHFAFGPFLCAGIVIAMLFGGPVLEWYCAFL